MGMRNIGKTLGFFLAFSTLVLTGCRSTGVIESDFGLHSTAHDAKIKVSMSARPGRVHFPQ